MRSHTGRVGRSEFLGGGHHTELAWAGERAGSERLEGAAGHIWLRWHGDCRKITRILAHPPPSLPHPVPNLACALQASGTAPPRGRPGGGAWAVGALGRPALLARERSGARVCAPPTLNPSPYRLIAPMAGWACALVNESLRLE